MVARALRLFDKVIIGIGFNEKKGNRAEAEAIASQLHRLFIDVPRVSVIPYSDLTIEAALRCDAGVIIRGYRNAIDAEYERQLAATNLMISKGEVETCLLAARPELECISSSMVRELSHFGHDVSSYLPTPEQCTRACCSDLPKAKDEYPPNP